MARVHLVAQHLETPVRRAGIVSPHLGGSVRSMSAGDLVASDWCGIYVKGATQRGWRGLRQRVSSTADVNALVALVASATRGRADGKYVTSPEGVEIYVGTNSTNPKFEPAPPPEADFVFWPFVIEMDVDEERGVPLVAAILRELWNQDLWAVAACSFEEKLPRSGGTQADSRS